MTSRTPRTVRPPAPSEPPARRPLRPRHPARVDAATRRQAFLDAATAVVRRDGPGASMQAMAHEAGVTKPILYREFGHRDGLLAALGEQFAQRLMTDLAQALEAGANSEPRAVLARTIDAFVALIERDPNLYRFLTERLVGAPNQPLAGLVDEISRFIALELGQRLRAAGADSGAAEPWAYGLVGMVHLAGDWWVQRRTMPREQLVEYLVSLTWEGMAGTTEPENPSGPAAPRTFV